MKLENLNTIEGQLKFLDDFQKFLIEEKPHYEKKIKQNMKEVKRRILKINNSKRK